MNGIKNSKAITLIALVVTVVVLMILAGISIQMLKGDNGIIGKANEAKLESRAGDVEELVQLWKIKNENIKTKNELEGKNDALVSKEEMLENLKKEDKVFDNEIDSEREVITIGTREIPYGEEVDKSALIILVNSGETGEVKLPILEIEEGRTIDWGDGVEVTPAKNKNTEGKKYASVIQNDGAKSKIADVFYNVYHTYPEENKEYIVTITGKCTELCANGENANILEIIQWGETDLKYVRLAGCVSLRKIASPTEKSFEKITDFSYGFYKCTSLISIPEDLFANCSKVTNFTKTFWNCTSLTSIPENLFANCPTTFEGTFGYCTSLTSIPENLFANCPNVTTFAGTFYNCTSLTSIPENLFANCPNVTSFMQTFYECTGLTGEPIKLWKRVPDGSTNNYKGTPDGLGCYCNATGLNNYENIPEYWRDEMT